MPPSEKNSASLRALWPALPAALLVLGGFVWPLARLCRAAFSTVDAESASSLSAMATATAADDARSGIVRLFADAYERRALAHSLALSLIVALASVAICLPAALALARGRFFGRALLRGLFALPMALSGVVVGFVAVAMLGNAGALPSLLHLSWLRGSAYTLPGLGAAYLYFEIPRATLTMEASLAAVDDGLLEAARTLGANRRQLLWRVFRPLCAPAVRAAFGVTFAASLGSFGVALIVAGRFALLPVELYRSFTGTLDEPLAAAMALTLTLLALLVLFIGGRDASRSA